MKKIRKYIRGGVVGILTFLARCALRIHKPFIIAITGSVGKTTTKDVVTDMLREAGLPVRSSRKSYNSEFGVPLSILNLPTGFRNPLLWLGILLAGCFRMFFPLPRYLILEVGLEFPGDIERIVRWMKPNVALLTSLPKDPVHCENFPDRESLYNEKVRLLRSVKEGGVALYSSGDYIQSEYVRDIPVTLLSFDPGVVTLEETGIHHQGTVPIGTDVVLGMDGGSEPFYIPEVLGLGAVKSLIAAVAVMRSLPDAVPVSVLRRAVASRKPTPGRMRVLPGLNGSVIIDDTYNASPVAMEAAIRTLAGVRMPRKIAVLGEMAELGDVSEEVHRRIGALAAETAECVFVVGDVEYGDHPRIRRGSVEDMVRYADADTVFLCKGSQVSRVERLVVGLLDSGQDPREVLVRQESHWR